VEQGLLQKQISFYTNFLSKIERYGNVFSETYNIKDEPKRKLSFRAKSAGNWRNYVFDSLTQNTDDV